MNIKDIKNSMWPKVGKIIGNISIDLFKSGKSKKETHTEIKTEKKDNW